MEATLLFRDERYDVAVDHVSTADRHQYQQSLSFADRWTMTLYHPEMGDVFSIADVAELVLSTDAGETNYDAYPRRFERDETVVASAECTGIKSSARAHWTVDNVHVDGNLETVLGEYDPTLLNDDDDQSDGGGPTIYSNKPGRGNAGGQTRGSRVPDWARVQGDDD